MLATLFALGLFACKALIILIVILAIVLGIVAIIVNARGHRKAGVSIKNLNKKYDEIKETLLHEIQSKKLFKKYVKEQKAAEKKQKDNIKHTFVLNFNGDIKASAVNLLREEITAVLAVATPRDEVVVCVESGGGLINAYGLAAAQLQRIRARNIPLTVAIDKIAASGGYLMACVANKIIAAPYAIVGSIGVIVQLPNFHRVLQDKHIDFEQHTAGAFKRTITVFGKNTDAERKKLHEELEEMHGLFKQLIMQHRPQVDIEQVATGEHWLAIQAKDLQLVDTLETSDDYLMAKRQEGTLFEIEYECKKALGRRLFGAASRLRDKLATTFGVII